MPLSQHHRTLTKLTAQVLPDACVDCDLKTDFIGEDGLSDHFLEIGVVEAKSHGNIVDLSVWELIPWGDEGDNGGLERGSS